MGHHRIAGAFAGECPVGVVGAEVVDAIRIVAGVNQCQINRHRRAAVLPGVLQVHHLFDLGKTESLTVGDVLRGDEIAPRSDRPVEAVLLHVHAACEQLGPRRNHVLRQIGLPFEDEVCAGFELGVLPRLCQPAVHKVLQLLRVVLAVQKFIDDFRKANKWRVEGVHPERHLFDQLGLGFHSSPLALPEHLRLVAVGNDAAALLADVVALGCPVCIGEGFVAGEFHLRPFEFDEFPAVRAGHEVMPDLVRAFEGFPDGACPKRRGGGHEDLPVVERLGSFRCQLDGVCLLFACAGVFVYLVQKKEADCLACEASRGV